MKLGKFERLGLSYQQGRVPTQNWFRRKAVNLTVRFVSWAFSFEEVQEAFVNQLNSRSTIDRRFRQVARDVADEAVEDRTVDADDVCGLERFVENEVDHALDNHEFDADSIKGLDSAIEEQVKDVSEEFMDELERNADEKLSKFKEMFDNKFNEQWEAELVNTLVDIVRKRGEA